MTVPFQTGTIKIDKVVSGHSGAPKKSKPNTVIDHLNKEGKTETRTFYGESGLKLKEITNHNHGNPHTHSYGNHGEHAHDYEWTSDGKLKSRTSRNLTDQERKDNGDML